MRVRQNKGYGTEAMEWLLEQAFKRFNLHKVAGEVYGWNTPARRLYRKVGFVEEGVRREHLWQEGAWQDEIELLVGSCTTRTRTLTLGSLAEESLNRNGVRGRL